MIYLVFKLDLYLYFVQLHMNAPCDSSCNYHLVRLRCVTSDFIMYL
jgi:hypothetical protein